MTIEEMLEDWDWKQALAAACNEYWYDSNEYEYCEIKPTKTLKFINNIESIVYSSEGERDSSSWIALFKLKNPVKGKDHCFISSGCDYTGWDCFAWGSTEYMTLDYFYSPLGTTKETRERFGIQFPDDDEEEI